jgi:hypothetical protein
MTKRTMQYGLLLLLIMAGASLLLPSVRYPLIGRLRGEKFVDGYPVSYWLMEAEERNSKAIQNLGQSDSSAVPVLLKILLEKGRGVSQARDEAARSLGRLGLAAQNALPELMSVVTKREMILGYPSPAYRASVEALKCMGPAAADAVPQLKLLLTPGHINQAYDVIYILATIGPEGRAAIPEMLVILEKYQGSPEALLAGGVLASWGVEEAIPLLFTSYDHVGLTPGDVNAALKKLYQQGKPVVAGAIPALSHKSRNVRYFTTMLLGDIGPAAKPSIPELQKLLTDEYIPLRELAQETIRKIESSSRTDSLPVTNSGK